jgi:hypothetical protein
MEIPKIAQMAKIRRIWSPCFDAASCLRHQKMSSTDSKEVIQTQDATLPNFVFFPTFGQCHQSIPIKI